MARDRRLCPFGPAGGHCHPRERRFLRRRSRCHGAKLSTVGARVEDFVPEERGKLSKPIIGGLLAGAASTVGKRVAGTFVVSSWPVAQAWFDRTTGKTDQMIWAGPLHVVDGKPDGHDGSVTTLKFDGDGNLALAYRLARFFATMGLDVGKFRMSATATITDADCSCTYCSYRPGIKVWTTGVVQQTWLSEKSKRTDFVAAARADNWHRVRSRRASDELR